MELDLDYIRTWSLRARRPHPAAHRRRDRPAAREPTDEALRGHGRRRVPRVTPVRAAARRGPRGRRASTTSTPARCRTSSTSATSAFDFRNVDVTDEVDVEGRVDYVFHLASPASPIDYLRLPLHTLKVGSYGTHHALGPREVQARPSVCWPPPPRCTATRACTRSRRRTGATSTRSAREACTTRPSGTRRPSPWRTTASRASTRASRASSTRTARACAPTTAGPCPRSCARPWGACRSPSSATARRRGRSATSTTSSRACCASPSAGEHTPVNLGNPDGAHAQRAGRRHHRRHRLVQPDRLRVSADRRPQGALPGHHQGGAAPRLAAPWSISTRACAVCGSTRSARRATR